MRIVLAGNGKLGKALAEGLAEEGHDIIIVDNNEEALARTAEVLDVMTLKGNAASIATMQSAEVDKADVLIATTENDEVNLISCMLGKKLGAKYVIARVREADYARDFHLVKEYMGIDRMLNPDQYAARSIERLLRFPSAKNIESFARGRVDMVGFTAMPGSPICDLPLKKLGKLAQGLLVCAVEHEGAIAIPNGDFVIRAGDHVHIMGVSGSLVAFFKRLGRTASKAKSIMIVGASRIAYYLAKSACEAGAEVMLIEKNQERCERLAEYLPDVTALHGDGTDMETLESEGLGSVDAFIALTDHDEDNILTSLYAKNRHVNKVIAKVNHINYMHLLGDLGLDSVILPRSIMADQIIRVVRGLQNAHLSDHIEILHRVLDGRVEAAQFSVSADWPGIGLPLRSLSVRPGILIAIILRGRKVILPGGDDSLHAEDGVIVVALSKTLKTLEDILL